MPDDEMYVTPPSRKEAVSDQPSTVPITNPGKKFNARSALPDTYARRAPAVSSATEYSTPSRKSSRMAPSSAPASMNSLLTSSGSGPCSPTTKPSPR